MRHECPSAQVWHPNQLKKPSAPIQADWHGHLGDEATCAWRTSSTRATAPAELAPPSGKKRG
eukprot:14205886-Alexandrium_andersonii.AAC.1